MITHTLLITLVSFFATPESSVLPPLEEEIRRIDTEIQSGEFGYIDKFMVMQKGELIFSNEYSQDYTKIMYDYDTVNHQYNYDHPDHHPFYMGTKLHTLQSVTKSITSLLFGIAMGEGHIKTVEQQALDYFPSGNNTDPHWKAMKLRDLLTMQSGIQWDEENYNEADNDCIIMEGKEDWIDYVLTRPMAEAPGNSFVYNSGASVLLGKIVREATGMKIDDYAGRHLFGPLGITEYHWKLTPLGEVDTEGGLYLRSEDLMKIGVMVMNGGMYEGKQIVPRTWIAESTQQWVEFNETRGYGYQWWVPGNDPRIAAGNGYGGQFLFIIPEKDVIVLFNGWNIHDRPEKSTYMAFLDRLLPLI